MNLIIKYRKIRKPQSKKTWNALFLLNYIQLHTIQTYLRTAVGFFLFGNTLSKCITAHQKTKKKHFKNFKIVFDYFLIFTIKNAKEELLLITVFR